MNEKPFFSIIIPTYNQSVFLEKAIKSVLLQKKNYEMIIIDNNSTDDTKKIVTKYERSNLKYLKINNAGIIGKSRNLGIKNAIAPWIAFLDSDDIWHKDKLSIIENFIKNNTEYDVITNDEEIIYDGSEKKTLWKYGPYTKNFYKKLILEGNCISTSASVVKKNFLEKKNILFSEKESFSSVEDYDFFLNLAFSNAKFAFYHKILGKHLYHNNSFSRNFQRHHKSLDSVLLHHINNVQTFTSNKKLLTKKVNTNLSIIKAFNEIKFNKQYKKGITLLLNVFFSNPLYFSLCIIKRFYIRIKNFNF